MKNTT